MPINKDKNIFVLHRIVLIVQLCTEISNIYKKKLRLWNF